MGALFATVMIVVEVIVVVAVEVVGGLVNTPEVTVFV